MLPLADYPVDGLCDNCLGPLRRLVFEFTSDLNHAPQSLLTPVVCDDCYLRHE
jgi:hypothetical protein